MSIRINSCGAVVDGSELDEHEETRAYELSVKLIFDRFDKCTTSSIVLDAIQSSGKSLNILPYTKVFKSDPNYGACNAFAYPDDIEDATEAGQSVLGKPDPKSGMSFKVLTKANVVPRLGAIPLSPGPALRSLLKLPQEPLSGTGAGSGTYIRYSPDMWGYGAACSPGKPGGSRGEVLLHEMLHAYRAMQGRGYRLPLIGGMAGYENLEEYFAIVVTNIYISDPTNTTPNRTLRANHGGFTPLPASQSTSGGFLGVKSNERLIAQFVSKMPELCVALRDVEATFNPIREYLSPASKPPSRNKPGGI